METRIVTYQEEETTWHEAERRIFIFFWTRWFFQKGFAHIKTCRSTDMSHVENFIENSTKGKE